MRFPAIVSLATLAAASLAAVPAAPSAAAEPPTRAARQITYTQWDSGDQWRRGTLSGVRVVKGRLLIKPAVGRRHLAGRGYDAARWDSPWVTPGFDLTRLIASWSAATPGDSWVEIRVRGRNSSGRTSSWDVLGRWTSGDRHLERRTVSGQDDDLARVNVDTWETAGLKSYQLRVTLARRSGASYTPAVDAAGAMASRLPAGVGATSKPGPARGTTLNVPRYSQMTHTGHYPRWGGGGQAWCSPTSTSMVLAYYGALPGPKAYAWVGRRHPSPWVDHAARMTYDYDYDGAGNWPFNTAYAARYGLEGFVTRLRGLDEAEHFIAADIPLVVSVSFKQSELTGAGYGTDGHLMVIRGFTADGDVIANDPASGLVADNAAVRRIYDRTEFENVWVPRSGGAVYVIHPFDVPLPPPVSPDPNW